MSDRSRLFDSVIISSWWVILFILTLFFIYDQATTKRNKEAVLLRQKHALIVSQKREAVAHLEELNLRLASKEDPLWIELLLREKLGLVGENETKVLFK